MQIQILKNQNTTIFWILGSPTHFGPNSTGKGITACNTGGGSTQSNTNSNKYKYKLIILGSPTHFVDAKVVHWKGDYRRWLNLIKVCTLLWKVGHSIVCPYYYYYYYFELMKVDPHLSLKVAWYGESWPTFEFKKCPNLVKVDPHLSWKSCPIWCGGSTQLGGDCGGGEIVAIRNCPLLSLFGVLHRQESRSKKRQESKSKKRQESRCQNQEIESFKSDQAWMEQNFT